MAENQHETGGETPNDGGHDGHDDHEGREDNYVRRLGRTTRAMRRHLERTISDVPGGMSAWWVLRYLHHAGPQAQADIAENIGIAGSTLTRRLEQMEADGLITRTVDDADKRRVIVALSERGEALRSGQRERADSTAEALLKGVSPEDLAAFGRVMERIDENLRALGVDPNGPGHGRGGGRGSRSGFGPGNGRGEGGGGRGSSGRGEHGGRRGEGRNGRGARFGDEG
jgi:MarR family transcriptional regulator for hemolysin